MKCDYTNVVSVPSIIQLMSKKNFVNRDEDTTLPFFSSKVEEWFMITFVVANCLLDLFVVWISIWNRFEWLIIVFFLSLKSWS